MTGPDLTPEQRETLAEALWKTGGVEPPAWDSISENLRNLYRRHAARVGDYAVARMVADARAEGERQGAARVTAAVEALAQHEDRLARGFADTFWHDYTARVLRAALAQATGEQS